MDNYDPFFMGYCYTEYIGVLRSVLDFTKSVDDCVKDMKKTALRAILKAVSLLRRNWIVDAEFVGVNLKLWKIIGISLSVYMKLFVPDKSKLHSWWFSYA